MNLTVQSPTRTSGTVTPSSPYFINTSKGGGIKGFCFPLRLGRRQTYFLPFPRPLILSFPRRHRADHGAIGLGHHVSGSDRRQHSKGFPILFIEQFLGSLRMLQSCLPHDAGVDFTAIVLPHPRGAVDERVI